MPDSYTMEARLCDDDGMVSDERVAPGSPGTAFDPDLTYRKLLNNLRARNGNPDARKPYEGEPFPCTGSAHVAGEHVRCTSSAHTRRDPDPVGQLLIDQHRRVTDMRAALAGYDAQFGERPIGEQHPELPRGCVERVEAIVRALRRELAREELAQSAMALR